MTSTNNKQDECAVRTESTIELIDIIIHMLCVANTETQKLSETAHLLRDRLTGPDTNVSHTSYHKTGKTGKHPSNTMITAIGVRKPRVHLTDREKKVLNLLYAGLSNAEIGEEIGVKPRTVKHCISILLARFDATNRTELVGCAVDQGYLHLRKE